MNLRIDIGPSSNYQRGFLFADKVNLKLTYPDLFGKDFVCAETYVITLKKSEESQGLLLGERLLLCVLKDEIYLLDGRSVIIRVPFSKLSRLGFKSFTNPMIYFPPYMEPKRASLFEISFLNKDSTTRHLTLLFPDTALLPSELTWDSEAVYAKFFNSVTCVQLMKSSTSRTFDEIYADFNSTWVPSEVSTDECALVEFLGAY
jgi:hypothetical protein